MTNALFAPVTVGDFELQNRIVMAPMTRSRSDERGLVPDFAADYYAQRADAALIISEATNISAQAVGYALTPGIWSEDQVEAWKPVVEAVHARGGHFLLQLWHTGRISHPDLHGGELPVAPSAIRPQGQAFTADGMKDHVEPRALETDEIPRDRRGLSPGGRERQGRRVRRRRGALRQQLSARAVRARLDEPPQRPVRRNAREPPALSPGGRRGGRRRVGCRPRRYPALAGDNPARQDSAGLRRDGHLRHIP